MNKEQLIAFEEEIAELFNNGKLPYCQHLSGGNEDHLIKIFKDIKPQDWVFSTWRNHYHYLLKGGSPDKLRSMILEGKSMRIMDKELNFFTSAIVGGCCSIAAGVAWSIKKRSGNDHVWCFVGDGAVDQGSFFEASRYVESMDLPCTFIIEDNGLSVETSYIERWGNGCTLNKLFGGFKCIEKYSYVLNWPHVQTGKFVKEYAI
jgi:TPP-dependent pyruvate/acetoin dehydrogenase alpha subunit